MQADSTDLAASNQEAPSRWVTRLLTQVEHICRTEGQESKCETIKANVLKSGLDWFHIQDMQLKEITEALGISWGFAQLLKQSAEEDQARNIAKGRISSCQLCPATYGYGALLKRHVGLTHGLLKVSPLKTEVKLEEVSSLREEEELTILHPEDSIGGREGAVSTPLMLCGGSSTTLEIGLPCWRGR